jgi:hypothetical protein
MPMSMPMIPMTTSSSTRLKPRPPAIGIGRRTGAPGATTPFLITTSTNRMQSQKPAGRACPSHARVGVHLHPWALPITLRLPTAAVNRAEKTR